MGESKFSPNRVKEGGKEKWKWKQEKLETRMTYLGRNVLEECQVLLLSAACQYEMVLLSLRQVWLDGKREKAGRSCEEGRGCQGSWRCIHVSVMWNRGALLCVDVTKQGATIRARWQAESDGGRRSDTPLCSAPTTLTLVQAICPQLRPYQPSVSRFTAPDRTGRDDRPLPAPLITPTWCRPSPDM
ncbi:hypothetical protein Bbelb_412460 [Branchiostoma belcheri]|nr:hypothetical protein Bbelb_412460 [Branchiostoma belcheri]